MANGHAPRGKDALSAGFRNPPNSARPRVWWHWMNGNISKDGIAKDLAWMKRIGIGGAQTFDAGLDTPQIVDKRLIYMTPAWKDAFHFAASESERLGLELTIASSPGWSETGGPWVTPRDGLKKLVWSETEIEAGTGPAPVLPAPPQIVGPFQSIPVSESGGSMLTSPDKRPPPVPYYADIGVFALPLPTIDRPHVAVARDGSGVKLDAAVLTDNDLSSAIALKSAGGEAPSIVLRYDSPVTMRSARVFLPSGASQFGGASYLPRIEASDDGITWRALVDVPLATVPTTVAFAPATAREFRLVMLKAKSATSTYAPATPGVDLSSLAKSFGAQMASPKLLVGEFRLSTEDRIDRAETKAGFSLTPDYFALSPNVPEANGIPLARVINITDRMRPDGTLDWQPPVGRWKILRLGYSLTGTMNHPASAEATGLEVDKFDGAAVRRYMEHYVAMYRGVAGPGLIGPHGVRGLLTDSIEVGPSNWTPKLIQQFRSLRGYDPTPWLPTLAGFVIGNRADSDRFLFDYRRTLADLLATEHYGTVAAVAHENGMTVYGEALEDGRPSLGDDMAMRRYTDVPMAALWTYPRARGPAASHLADMKGAASVAHVYGKRYVAAESMTSLLSPWASAPADLKRVVDLEFATGINRPVIHTSVHVPTDDKKPGLTLSIFGQYFNRNESWAELAKPWIDYISRNAFMLQQGRNVADVAYYYGEEAPLTGLYSQTEVADEPRSVGYDFINASALTSELRVKGGLLGTAGGARYRILYLGGSSRAMSVATLRVLERLVLAGAVVVGPKPQFSPSLSGHAAVWNALVERLWPQTGSPRSGARHILASSDISAALKSLHIADDFAFTGANKDAEILFAHRKLADGDSYFLSNRKDRSETGEMHFRVTGKVPELWHAETGLSETVGYRVEGAQTIVPITLEPDASVHVVFRKVTNRRSLVVTPALENPSPPLGGPWSVAFQPGRGAPATTVLPTLVSLETSADPAIRYFSGIATYTRDFIAPPSWQRGKRLFLDLGDVGEVAEVNVNGQRVGGVWHAPYRLDISGVVRPGTNHLTIRVANLWVNRLIGDAQPGAAKVAWAAGPTYVAKAPLRRSGLIGPVRLIESR